AHVQPTGAYHYHGLPTGLIDRLGGDADKMLLIGYAADGFPMYTSRAHKEASDANSPIVEMKSSYRLKAGTRPDGPGGRYDGTFTRDFEFVAGAGDLDECNGRTGVTPENPEGTYYYALTKDYPFIPRMLKGEPDPSFERKGPPPGGGPGGPGGPGRGRGRPPGPPGGPRGGGPPQLPPPPPR
ncbi:MAG TPA: YHYH protein, partial [Caulifigura sp.]|nr:YHYH protein [Caulifigura sp.]